jgi:crotonobetainyl-CoA:carnitine CoA-transferase CaiB-like acyl-CoA transferase
VIAIEQFGAGPLGSMYLADLGATVIKVEDPQHGGDVGRYIAPGQQGRSSLYFESFNRNKGSVALDLRAPNGRRAFETLVADADVVFSNLRGDEPERLRIRYADLASINTAIVCVTLSAYGTTGSQSHLPGYDAIIQAEAGWAALTGEPDAPPTKTGLSLVDYVAGLTAMVGLLAAVIQARRTGLGGDVDTNLYDSALAMLTYPATWYLSAGIETVRRPMSAHPSVVPFQFFRTADGFVAIACPKDKFFIALIDGLGLGELHDDARFATLASRGEHRDALVPLLDAAFAAYPTSHWLDRLRTHVPIAPVRSLAEVLDPDELRDRGMLAEYEHEVLGRVRSIGLPIHISGFDPVYRPGPAFPAERFGDSVPTGVAERPSG